MTDEPTVFEGWSNWETWNVVLYMDGDPDLQAGYRAAVAIEPFTASTVESYIREAMPLGTVDFRAREGVWSGAALYDRVDWPAVAEHLNGSEP